MERAGKRGKHGAGHRVGNSSQGEDRMQYQQHPLARDELRIYHVSYLSHDRRDYRTDCQEFVPSAIVAALRPAGGKLAQRDRDWDKEDRTSHGFRLWLRPAKIIV